MEYDIMETRMIEQVKIWSLKLNSIYKRAEDYEVVILSTSKQKIINYYNLNKCEKYKEGIYTKSFKKGSLLEDYNPIHSEDLEKATTHYGESVFDWDWMLKDILNKKISILI